MPSNVKFIELEMDDSGCLVASIKSPVAILALVQEVARQMGGQPDKGLLMGKGRADKLLYLLRHSPEFKDWQEPNAPKAIKETSDTLYLWTMGLDPPRQNIFHEIFPSFYAGNIKVRTKVQGSWGSHEGKLESWGIVGNQIRLQINGAPLTLPVWEWTVNRRLIMFDLQDVYQLIGDKLWQMRGKEYFQLLDQDGGKYLIAAVPDLA